MRQLIAWDNFLGVQVDHYSSISTGALLILYRSRNNMSLPASIKSALLSTVCMSTKATASEIDYLSTNPRTPLPSLAGQTLFSCGGVARSSSLLATPSTGKRLGPTRLPARLVLVEESWQIRAPLPLMFLELRAGCRALYKLLHL